MKLILEVAKDWINDFSEGSLRQLLAYLTKMLEDGTANLSLISSVYMVCRAARQRFQLPVDLWVDQINETSKEYLLNNMNGFRLECDERFVNYLLIYCETITDLSKEPNPQLLEMLVNYLKDAVNGKCSMSIQTDGLRKLNLIVEILARFALRDSDIACKYSCCYIKMDRQLICTNYLGDITPNLGALLRRQTQMTTVNPITKCLSDLCKKHTSFVEPVLKEVVHKLTSKNDAVRLCALENLYVST